MKLLQLYNKLFNCFGPQHWWPAKSKFEIIIGAILTQQTSWKQVEKAIENLRKAHLLNPMTLSVEKIKSIENCVKPAGFYKQKARRIKKFSKYLIKKYSTVNKFLKSVTRGELLELDGIGKETADSILLYAANKPTFIADAYTFRIINRVLGYNFKSYSELQKFFEDQIPRNVKLFNEFHALIIELGKNYCKIKPNCEKCPLNEECNFASKRF
jgi:endonuclease-3 related protein